MLHNHKRWAFPCPADKVGPESLKPFEGLRSGLVVQLCLETCLGLPTVSLQQTQERASSSRSNSSENELTNQHQTELFTYVMNSACRATHCFIMAEDI